MEKLEKLWNMVLFAAVIIAFAAVIQISFSCATMMEAQKPFQELTPKEKAVYLLSMYNKQYDEYLVLYKKGDHTKEEKLILQKKYELLKELHPYIGVYLTYSETGEMPNDLVEQKLIDLIHKLLEE